MSPQGDRGASQRKRGPLTNQGAALFTSGRVSGETGLSLYETVAEYPGGLLSAYRGSPVLRELPAKLWRVSLRTAVRTLSGFPFGLPSYGPGDKSANCGVTNQLIVKVMSTVLSTSLGITTDQTEPLRFAVFVCARPPVVV